MLHFLLSRNEYELIIVAVLVVTHIALAYVPGRRISRLAVASAILGILNPTIVEILVRSSFLCSILYATGLGLVSRGDSELRSFLFGLAAIVTGHIAIRRIRKTIPVPRGRQLAIVGLCFGYLWVVGWAVLLIAFMSLMSFH